MSNTIREAGTRKTLDISKSLSVTRSYVNLQLCISRWSKETHSFITSWGECTAVLEEVAVIARPPLFGDPSTMVIVLGEEKEKTL